MGLVRHTHMLIAILHTIFGGKVIISLYIFLTEKLFEVFRWWFGFPYRSQVWWQCIVTNHLTVSSCFLCKCNLSKQLPSVLWCRLLGSIKSIQSVKNTEWQRLAWLSVWDKVQTCIWSRKDIAMPLTISCFSKIQIGFTFQLSAHPGSPGQQVI